MNNRTLNFFQLNPSGVPNLYLGMKAGKPSFYEDALKEARSGTYEKVMLVGCGAYMDSGYGCPGAWRCLKAAAMGEGKFDEPMQVMSFVKCQCPGRSLVANVGMAMKLAKMKPEAVYFSSCLANAKPACPYGSPEEISQLIQGKTRVPVIFGTHDYH